MSKTKYYAVKKGRETGIFTRWAGNNGAETQVKSFLGAVFKSFPTEDEAVAWLKNPTIFSHHEAHRQAQNKALAPDVVEIYTDGACSGNPGPGGYGAIIRQNGREIKLSKGYRLTTNNRMELMACIAALKSLSVSSEVRLFTDSKYIVNAVNQGWAQKWRKNHWMRNKKDKAENPDLWEQLLSLLEVHDVKITWVKGHSGHSENEKCDKLAVSASQNPTQSDKVFENKKNS